MKDFDFGKLKSLASQFDPLPSDNSFLNARYDWQKNDNGVEWPYYRFFYHLAQMLQPGLVVELGGYQGTAAAHFAAGWPEGTVITIDHHTDPGDDANKAKMLEACQRYPNIKYFQGWTTDTLATENRGKHSLGDAGSAYQDVMAYILEERTSIDILFIDSWHVYEYASADWIAYSPLLSETALVICDDILDEGAPGSPISGMRRFWDELPEPKFLNTNLHPGSRMGFVKVEKIKSRL